MATPPPPPQPADPVALIDDLVEEFLLRLPPEDPAGLARAALVSRQWHRVITGPVFRRRFREFHRSPPLLGYIVNRQNSIRLVPLSSFRRRQAVRRDVLAVHSSHGRVLLRRSILDGLDDVLLSVWDPLTDEVWDLPPLPCTTSSFWDAAVVCAVGDGCNHLDCHFNVVFVGSFRKTNFSCFYSSEARSWSDPIFTSGEDHRCFITGARVLVAGAVYFRCGGSNEILKYNLLTHQMSTITLQHDAPNFIFGCVLIATEDGRVGVAKTINSKLLMLSSTEHGRWTESRVIELHTLLPDHTLRDFEDFDTKPWAVGFADTGGGVIFLQTHVGYFTIDLNSGKSKKVEEILRSGGGGIVPYMSFCTPTPGAFDEGLGAGVAVFTDDVPVALAISSYDDRLGNGVVVSIDEGSGAGMSQMHKKLKLTRT